MKNILRIIVTTLSTIIVIISLTALIFFGWLKGVSPGRTELIRDTSNNEKAGSIAEVRKMEIGGIRQLVVIRGEDINNPVLLMLHGGPGSPQMPLNILYNKELEKDFIVVNWDQRGAGGSYSKDILIETITIEQMVEDTRELSTYLIERFQKDKIFILGHSWGSYLGMRVIHKHPELYTAYIGIGQVADQVRSEQMSYNYVLGEAKRENNKKAIKELEEIGFPGDDGYKNMWKSLMIERKWVMNYGGAAYGKKKMDLFKMIIWPVFTSREYTVKDKFNYVKGMNLTQNLLFGPMMKQPLTEYAKEVKVPIYILQGKHDYQTCFDVAKGYFDSLQAPQKKFIEFSKSSHMLPYNLEKDKFHSIMKEIKNEKFSIETAEN